MQLDASYAYMHTTALHLLYCIVMVEKGSKNVLGKQCTTIGPKQNRKWVVNCTVEANHVDKDSPANSEDQIVAKQEIEKGPGKIKNDKELTVEVIGRKTIIAGLRETRGREEKSGRIDMENVNSFIEEKDDNGLRQGYVKVKKRRKKYPRSRQLKRK